MRRLAEFDGTIEISVSMPLRACSATEGGEQSPLTYKVSMPLRACSATDRALKAVGK